ncbi:MAG: hypothetical protein A2216_01185 [Omnitrophica WOR_2 bacterium RIFOXYA2_FULL_45_12]|nr:MAG: hypothetical protein A2216_01185 [Omnitrophica WOR_2 bacterium RIFOXYA2_FULL_45_12]OGX60858.1 MAG: hypothetical protein A2471_01790 [Omnitrophica WOR_2 bacterium RIFOXYC2_FULL_45_15]
MVYNFTVSQEDLGKRIDVFLTDKLKDNHSRTFIQRLILNKDILLNGRAVKPNQKLNLSDTIQVTVPESAAHQINPEDIKLKVIYEDDDILVIDKPSGLVVHPGAGNLSGTLVNALLAHTRNLSAVNPQRPGIVHRLDKGTSGVMVVAKNNLAHLKLIKQFSTHRIKKKYIAIVKGKVECDEGIIDLPIGRHKRDFKRQAVSFVNARPAVTNYKVLRRFDDYATLLELNPQTGRTHQLRVHLAHLGHPILGDSKYGTAAQPDFPRLALHALELGIFHPQTKKFLSFSSELPAEFTKFR